MSKIYDALKKRENEVAPATSTEQKVADLSQEGTGAEKESSAAPRSESSSNGGPGAHQDNSVRTIPEMEVPGAVLNADVGDATSSALPAEPPDDRDARLFEFPSLLIDRMPDFFQEMAGLYRNLFILQDGNLGTIMLCGIESGVGTTMIAMNLASYIVQQEGQQTLFVDANLRNPSLFRYQDHFAHAGFHELITEQGPLTNYVLPTNIPKLFAMNAGKVADINRDLFNSRALDYAVSEWRASYPVVVVDAPPLGSGPESLDLAKCVDGVILVVRSNSSAEDVRNAKTALENAQAHIVGVVFNQH